VPDGANWDRTDFYYTRSWQVVEEHFAGDVSTENKDAVAATAKYQYVWSLRYIDACILRDEDKDADGDCTDAEGAGGSERLYYASGANMEVTAVANTSGTVQERYTYTPYGQPTIHDNDWSDTKTWANSTHNEILYSGYRYDDETGLYHVRYRTYHPTLGRWAQRDVEGYLEGLGLYEYVAANPSARVDPLGARSAATSGPITRTMVEQWIEHDEPLKAEAWKLSREWKAYLLAQGVDYKSNQDYRAWKDEYENRRDQLAWNKGHLPSLCNKEGDAGGEVVDAERGPTDVLNPDERDKLRGLAVAVAGIADITSVLAGTKGGSASAAKISTLVDVGAVAVWPTGTEAIIEVLKLEKRITKIRKFVWVKIQCYVCSKVKKDGNEYLMWVKSGDAKWHSLDNMNTLIKGSLWGVDGKDAEERKINEALPSKVGQVCGGS